LLDIRPTINYHFINIFSNLRQSRVSLQGVRFVALRDKTALIFKASGCGAIASSDAIQNCRAGIGLLQDAHDLNQHKSQIFSYKPLPLYYEKNSI